MTRSPPPTTGRVGAVLDHLSTEACYAREDVAGHQLIEADGFRRRRLPAPHQPGRRPPAPHPRRRPQPGPRRRRPVVRPRRPAPLHLWKKTAGTLYQSALRAELAPLGLAWDIRRNGLSELRDIPKSGASGVLQAPGRHRGRRWSREGATSAEGSRDRRSRHSGTQACRRHRGRRAARRIGPSSSAAIELPDGAGGTRPASVDDLTAALGREAVARTRARRGRGGLSGPGRRERRVARRLGDRRTAPLGLRRPRHQGNARHPARIDLHPTGRHQCRGQGIRRHPRRGSGAHGQIPRPGRGRPGPRRPRCRHRAHPDPERPRRPGHERRPALHDHRAAGRRTAHHRLRLSHAWAKEPAGSPPTWSNTSSSTIPISTANRPTVCGHCSPRATATTW